MCVISTWLCEVWGVWSLHSSVKYVCVWSAHSWMRCVRVCERARMCGLHIAVWSVCVCGLYSCVKCVCGLYVAVWGACVCDLHIAILGACVCVHAHAHMHAHTCCLRIAAWDGWLPENSSTALYHAELQVCAQQLLALYVGAENLNWGPHASIVRTQPVSHLPSPQNSHF